MIHKRFKWYLKMWGLFFLLFATQVCAEEWSKQYIESLPDSAFAVIEVTKDGRKVRHLPHHTHTGEIDINHLKSALGRIYQVKWIDPQNFAIAKEHLEQHNRIYKEEQAKARGLKAPININKASIEELKRLPGIGEKHALAIIEYRKNRGSFKNISELLNVPQIGLKVYMGIEDLITVE